MINRENLAKSLVAAVDLVKGTVISSDHIKVLSPGQGLSAQYYEQLLGRTLQRDMAEEEYFYPSDLQEKRIEPRSYRFNRPWGVPVRYHDFSEYHSKISPDIFEFHLSYSDLDLDADKFWKENMDATLLFMLRNFFQAAALWIWLLPMRSTVNSP